MLLLLPIALLLLLQQPYQHNDKPVAYSENDFLANMCLECHSENA
jgi:hypothetical protein